MNLHIGQKLRCIDDSNFKGAGDEAHPVRGGVYTIRSSYFSKSLQCELIRLVEIVNTPRPYVDGYLESGFYPSRFRAVRSSDISVFKAMLSPVVRVGA